MDGDRASARVATLVRIVFLAVCAASLASWLVRHVQEVEAYLVHLDAKFLLFSVAVLTPVFLGLPLGLVWLTRGATGRVRYGNSLRTYYLGQFSKYLPGGGVWAFASRILALRKDGVLASHASAAIYLEQVALAASAMIVGAGYLGPALLAGAPTGILVGIPAVVVALVLAPVTVPRILARLPRRGMADGLALSLDELGPRRHPARFILLVLHFVVVWSVAGASFFLLAKAVVQDLGVEALPLFVGTMSASWLVGFLAVFLPAGLGAREVVMVALLAPTVSSSAAVLISLLARVVWTVMELGFFLVAHALPRGVVQGSGESLGADLAETESP